ncbi:MAG: Gfo/Idh/MocA family oxidoreductase [Armatimonadota bacterium]|nr:Gfo/Idh/MocA family oxidoreductase [Armatimonadota bacterium]
MSRVVGMGVVGAGSIGIRAPLQHLSLPDVQDRVCLAAVCDPFPGRAKAAAERFNVRSAYESLEELLADERVDAVTLCSPIGLHYDQGLQAIRAGKHVHFNKTMTVTSAEATHLIDEAAQRGVKLVASPGQMIPPLNRRIRKLIQDGALGRLAWASTGAAFMDYHEHEGVRTGTDVLSNINPAWYWKKPGGGPLYDMTVYGLHTLTGILGPARRVTAMSGVAVTEREFKGEMYSCDAEDNTLMVLDFGNTLFSFVYGTFAGTNTEFGQPSFFGSHGSIVGDKFNGKPIDYPGKDNPDMHPRGPHVTASHHLEECHVFEDVMQLVDLIRDGIPTPATPEHARHVVEIIEAALRASETGQTQALKTTFEPVAGE